MSGRWRSRHWQGSGGNPNEMVRDRSNSRERHNGNNGSNGYDRGFDNFNNRRGGQSDDRRSEQGFQQNRQQFHDHQSWNHNNNNNAPNTHDRWQRGQSVSLPARDRSRERRRDGDAHGQRAKQGQGVVTNRSASTGHAGSTFSTAPAQAWGNNNNKPPHTNPSSQNNIGNKGHRDSNASSAKNDTNPAVKIEKRGWTKPDSNLSSKNAIANNQKNAWPEPTSSLQKSVNVDGKSTTSETNATQNTSKPASFPTGIVKKEADYGSSQPQAKNPNPWAAQVVPAEAKSNMSPNESAFPTWSAKDAAASTETKSTISSTTLPSSSSWGKAKAAPAVQAAPQASGWVKPLKQTGEKKGKKANVFPSLSASSSKQQKHSQKQLAAKTVTPSANEKSTKQQKQGSSKKGATPASLASFLSPLAGGGAPTSSRGTKKKHPSQLQPKQFASKMKIGSMTKPHGVSKPHPGLSNIAVGGVKRSAPSPSTTMASNKPTTGGGGSSDFPPTGMKGGAIKKGRQRLAPRKKKLTTLKKRVLKERLRVWQEQNGIDADNGGGERNDVDMTASADEQGLSAKRLRIDGPSSEAIISTNNAAISTTLLVENYVRPEEDDLTDEDEYDEILSNLISLAGRVGTVLSVFVPRPANESEDTNLGDDSYPLLERKHVGSAFVRYASTKDVCAAKDILHDMVVGGQKIGASILHSDEMAQFNSNWNEGGAAVAPSAENERQWHVAVLKFMDDRPMNVEMNSSSSANDNMVKSTAGTSTTSTIIFHQILCDDDYEDEDALEESIEDIKGLAQQYGQVEDARASTSGDDKGNVYIAYENQDSACKAMQQLNGIVLGGSKIIVSKENSLVNGNQQPGPGIVVLSNVLNDDDFEDEDCLNESIEDIRNLSKKYGSICSVDAKTTGKDKGHVHMSFVDGHLVAQQAVQGLNGMVFGGLIISATVLEMNPPTGESLSSASNQQGKKSEPTPPPPLYSGDKIVPERFAACKRVPKIPNSGTPRAYATKIADEQATPLVIEMIGELMRLQERSKDDKNARARRRLVMGLREVARGIRAHKVKMVVMANNLDQYGAIDTKLQEILDSANAEDIPVVFELNKRKLGKSLGKSIKVSVVGIQNADGAHEQFKRLKKMIGAA